jgi:hypothetical protein
MMHLKVSTFLHHRDPITTLHTRLDMHIPVGTFPLLTATRSWKEPSMPSAIQYLTDRWLWTDSDSDAWVS